MNCLMNSLMKCVMRIVLAFGLSVVADSHAMAQTCGESPASDVVKIYFANGMFTTPEEAARGVKLLRNTFESRLKDAAPSATFYWAQAYNEDEKALEQLLEVVTQKISDVATVGLTKAADFLRIKAGVLEEPPWYTEARNKVATAAEEVSYVLDSDLRKHVALYRNDVLSGKRVVVFAHSQGNFYTNAAYDLLYKGDHPIEKNSFGMVSVATPSHRVADQGPYTTFKNDTVINAVRLVMSGTLPGNTDFEPFEERQYSGSVVDGVLNAAKELPGKALKWVAKKVTSVVAGVKAHNWSSYLYSSKSQVPLLEDARSELATLVSQSPAIKLGAVSVALDWNRAGSDLDLYVTEPDGVTVYYGKVANVGELDRDVQNQAGPEHYFIACDKLQQGTFVIRAKYHSGQGGEDARVQVSAGSLTRTFSYAFDGPQARDDEPAPIAMLVVSQSPSGGWTYEIEPAP